MISDYEGKLVPAIKGIINAVVEHGRPFGSMLRESLNIGTTIEFNEENFDITTETSEVAEFYGKELGFDDKLSYISPYRSYDRKYEEEREHYLFLKHGLAHKIRATKYFFGQGTESRKNIIFSEDCISSIQFIERRKELILNVYMRSSDVVRLLPIDILAISSILEYILKQNRIEFIGRKASIHILIASAHIVKESDLERAESLKFD